MYLFISTIYLVNLFYFVKSGENLKHTSVQPSRPKSDPKAIAYIQHLCPPMYYFCDELPSYCLNCDFDYSCKYGSLVNVTCRLIDGVYCKVATVKNQNKFKTSSSKDYKVISLDKNQMSHTDYEVKKSFICRYCHQLDDNDVVCIGRVNCHFANVARSFYETSCEPFGHILCLGKRVFRRMVPCNWSSGKKYIVAVSLSLFFGGLGVDRFYLGMWAEGLGKLFSFGGLGIWSMIDFILILLGYIKPIDDAVYW